VDAAPIVVLTNPHMLVPQLPATLALKSALPISVVGEKPIDDCVTTGVNEALLSGDASPEKAAREITLLGLEVVTYSQYWFACESK